MCNGTLPPCNALCIAVQHHPHCASYNKREMVCFRNHETTQAVAAPAFEEGDRLGGEESVPFCFVMDGDTFGDDFVADAGDFALGVAVMLALRCTLGGV